MMAPPPTEQLSITDFLIVIAILAVVVEVIARLFDKDDDNFI